MLMHPVCSTKAKFYEDAFASLNLACDGEAPLATKLRCKNLLTDLTLANAALRHHNVHRANQARNVSLGQS